MNKLLLPLVVLALAAAAFAGDEENQAANRVKAASMVLEEIQNAPDTGIPDEVMGSAECVAVVPSMLKAGFVFGAQYGRGVASCRTAKGWSDPAFFAIQGGSFGLQIGGQAVDLVMLIMNHKGMEHLMSSSSNLAQMRRSPPGRLAATLPPTPIGRCAPRC
jgi:lipid-binding SYLF domain-containing protein